MTFMMSVSVIIAKLFKKHIFNFTKFAMNPCCTPSQFKPVTHVIFDLDGTIVDTETIYYHVINAIAEKYGKSYSHELDLQIAGTVETETSRLAVELMDLPITPQEFLAAFRDLSDEQLRTCPLMPGVERMIRHLYDHGIPIAICTSSSQSAVDIKASKKRDIFDMFHHIVCAASDPEVKRGKPHPDPFLVCASRFDDKPHPSQCLVFEDSVNGVQGAVAAGMQVVMIPTKNVPHELWKGATLRIDSFNFMAPELFGLPPLLPLEGIKDNKVDE